MIDKKHLEDLHNIASELGYEEQSMQLIEEMAELTQGINKHRRYGTFKTHLNVVEEIADVLIMLEQIKYLLYIDDKKLNFIIDSKIKRTKKRIAEKGSNNI